MAHLEKIYNGKVNALSVNIEVITPMVAQQLLGTGNKNRKETNVERYAFDMGAGKWFLSGQPVLINSNNELVDGFNRCKASIKSNSPFIALVVRGIESKAFDVIDIGKSRSLTDLLTMKTDVQYTSIVGYIAKRIVCLEEGREVGSSTPTTRLEEMSAVRRHRETVEDAAQFARTRLGSSQSSLLAFLYWYYTAFLGNKKAKEFFNDYAEVARHCDLSKREESTYTKGTAPFAETLYGYFNGQGRKPIKLSKQEATTAAVCVIEAYLANKNSERTIRQILSGVDGISFGKIGVITHRKSI